MPRGVHSGARGRKPLPIAERYRRRRLAVQRAKRKYYRSHLQQITDKNCEQRFRQRDIEFRLSGAIPADATEAFRVVPLVRLQAPRWIVEGADGQRRYERLDSAEALANRLGPLLRMRAPLVELLRAAECGQ